MGALSAAAALRRSHGRIGGTSGVPRPGAVIPVKYRVSQWFAGLTAGHGIGPGGEVVGDRVVHGGMRTVQGCVATRASMQDLGTLGGSFSTARSINAHGVVVGGALTDGDESHHGFIWHDGRMVDLNDLVEPRGGWEVVHALGINDHGQIVAIAARDGEDHVVLLEPMEIDETPCS